MGSIYKRNDRYYVRFKDLDGKWVSRAASDNLAGAKKILREVEKGVKELPSSREPAPPNPASTPFRALVAPWLKRRKERGIRVCYTDAYVMNKRILPILGDMPIGEIKLRHVRNLVDSLRAADYAPRTIICTYNILHKFFLDHVVDEVIPLSPCVLTKDQLPKNRDRDPEWRVGALFSREEVELILSTPDIPEDRRMLYSLMLLTGMRIGESVGLRWRDIDQRTEPFQRILVARSYNKETKTETPRLVPIHPLLSTLLADWRAEGFRRLAGRSPGPDDLVVPGRRDKMRWQNQAWELWEADISRLGLRHRRLHDTRRTFITLARVDGARKDVLEQITHGQKGSVIDMYTSLPWPTLCDAVACLKLRFLTEEERIKIGQELRQQALNAPAKRQIRKLTAGSLKHTEVPAAAKPQRERGPGKRPPRTTPPTETEVAKATTPGVQSVGPESASATAALNGLPSSGSPEGLVTSGVTRKGHRGTDARKTWELHVFAMTGELPPLSSTMHYISSIPTPGTAWASPIQKPSSTGIAPLKPAPP